MKLSENHVKNNLLLHYNIIVVLYLASNGQPFWQCNTPSRGNVRVPTLSMFTNSSQISFKDSNLL